MSGSGPGVSWRKYKGQRRGSGGKQRSALGSRPTEGSPEGRGHGARIHPDRCRDSNIKKPGPDRYRDEEMKSALQNNPGNVQ
jgi:hypothetical protein